MSAFKPGVGDPLGHENPYCDGKPNWNLQAKTRRQGPREQLSNNLSVTAPAESPYRQEFPDKYVWSRTEEQRGRRHYGHHLEKSEREAVHRGYGIPDHVHSGFEVPDKRTGRGPAPPLGRGEDPKDGGVWEPVQRQYPKVPRIEHKSGLRVVDKKGQPEVKVDIWPTTISVRDRFQPGGLKMFEGRRATNTEAFPGALGYQPPKMVDEQGNKVDYSSVQYGGPFGYKLMHDNVRAPLADGASLAWKVDRTAKYKDAPRAPSPALSAAAKGFMEMSATTSERHVPVLALGNVRGGSRGGSGRMGGTVDSLLGGGVVTPAGGSRRLGRERTPAEPKAYTIPRKGQYEQPLVASTNWTFLGSYRP